MRKYSKRKVAATIAITAILVGGGGAAAIAYWTSGGSGSGTAATGTSTAITANQNALTNPLAPGVAAQTLSGGFTNSTGAAVFVNTVTASIASVTGGTPAAGCTAADYTLLNPVMKVGATGTSIPTGTTLNQWSGATIQFNNTTANQDACKGATVNLSYAIG